MGKYRKFNGKEYKARSYHRKKAKAKEKAKKLKINNDWITSNRIVKEGKEYVVYIHSKGWEKKKKKKKKDSIFKSGSIYDSNLKNTGLY